MVRVNVPDSRTEGQPPVCPGLLQDGEGLVVRELGVEQRGALELGEAGLAGVAVQQPVASLAEVAADRKVAGPPPSVEVAVRVLAAEAFEIVRGHGASWIEPSRLVES
jgi:hypothetical protein